jgi:hypothetical protein
MNQKPMDELAVDLLTIAERYKVEGLKELAEDHLIRTISKQNIINLAVLSERQNAAKLKNVTKN